MVGSNVLLARRRPGRNQDKSAARSRSGGQLRRWPQAPSTILAVTNQAGFRRCALSRSSTPSIRHSGLEPALFGSAGRRALSSTGYRWDNSPATWIEIPCNHEPSEEYSAHGEAPRATQKALVANKAIQPHFYLLDGASCALYRHVKPF